MFVGLILFLTGTVLPALGVGALLGLASTGFEKLIVANCVMQWFVSWEGR